MDATIGFGPQPAHRGFALEEKVICLRSAANAGRGYRCLHASTAAELVPHLAAWERLEERALEDNVYLSPTFLASVLRHLKQPPSVVFVYAGDRLVGVAAFDDMPPRVRRPLRTLATSAGTHGYHTFPLLDREHAREAFSALWDWVERPGAPWSLVLLDDIRASSDAYGLIEAELTRRRRSFIVKERVRRLALHHGTSFDDYLASLPSPRRKAYRRCWRRLSERGRVEVLLHRDLERDPEVAERFLRLERLGWKGEAGSALACRPGDEAFFREVAGGLGRRRRLFFVEVRLDGRPIAMTSNFVSGQSLFAFKVAYDPEFKLFSPGIVNEVESIRLFQEASVLRYADSGTVESSWTSAYWRESVEMRSLYVAMPGLGSSAYLRAFPFLTGIRTWLRGRGAGGARKRVPAQPRDSGGT